MTSEDEEIYNNSHICWICKQELNMDKVRDYCHVTGRFRGAAHNKCNINLRLPRKLPIIFHNFQGYDGHIIFKELNNFNVDIDVILKGIDKYMSIIVNRHINFIDSLQFYNGSLDILASNLINEDFKHLTSQFGIDKLEILKRKDVYPYEWVDSYEKFKHPSLPEKKYFYSSLKDGKRDRSNGHISNEQYQHLQNVWDTFNFNTFEDFHNHYLKKDVLLLADVFEKFIFTCLKYYDLDPSHYFSAPGLSWDAMLKMTGVTLEKISDPDKYMSFEQGIRGGLSYIKKRYSEASENVNILCLYMNDLYGYAMSSYLPINDFKWVKNIHKIQQKLMNLKNNSSTGYVPEVDLEYPQELHDINNDYQLASEKINIPNEWLSDYGLKIANEHNITIGSVKKLVPNLMSKNNYVIHYRNLQQCLELGIKLKKNT